MSEHTDNLVLELLRQIRADMAAMKDDMSMMRSEMRVMRVMRQHIAALVGTQTLQDIEMASVKVRLDRIERRLELVD